MMHITEMQEIDTMITDITMTGIETEMTDTMMTETEMTDTGMTDIMMTDTEIPDTGMTNCTKTDMMTETETDTMMIMVEGLWEDMVATDVEEKFVTGRQNWSVICRKLEEAMVDTGVLSLFAPQTGSFAYQILWPCSLGEGE